MAKNGLVVKLRRVTDDDCRLLWTWANDPGVRAASFEKEPIPWETHVHWFQAKKNDPRSFIYVATDSNGTPAGQVRFDLDAQGGAEVHISVATEKRGLGYGSVILRLACERVLAEAEVKSLVAHVRPENVLSLRIFEKAGFIRQGTEVVKGHGCERLVLPLGARR